MASGKTCTKCLGAMWEGRLFGGLVKRPVSFSGDAAQGVVRAYVCQNCGYVELYLEKA